MTSNGWGFAGSLETGYPIALGNGVSLIPQTQLVYQHLSLDGGQDRFGTIDYKASNASYGRIGGKLSKDWVLDDDRSMTTFVRSNVWHDFGAQATTVFNTVNGQNPVALKTDLGGTWNQVGLGVSGQVDKDVSLFASADYNFALGQGNGSSLGGRAGIRLQW